MGMCGGGMRVQLLSILSTIPYRKQYNIPGTKIIDIHMSNNESLDEETKRILAEVNSDAQSGTDDSKESKPKKQNKAGYDIDDDGYETNTLETDDSEW